MGIEKIEELQDTFFDAPGTGAAIPRTGVRIAMSSEAEAEALGEALYQAKLPEGLTVGVDEQYVLVDASPPGLVVKEDDIVRRLEAVGDFLEKQGLLNAVQVEVFQRSVHRPHTPTEWGALKDKAAPRPHKSRSDKHWSR